MKDTTLFANETRRLSVEIQALHTRLRKVEIELMAEKEEKLKHMVTLSVVRGAGEIHVSRLKERIRALEELCLEKGVDITAIV